MLICHICKVKLENKGTVHNEQGDGFRESITVWQCPVCKDVKIVPAD